MKRTILVIDGYAVQAYSVGKSLKSIGCKVIMQTTHKVSYGYVSKYPDIKIIGPKSSSKLFYSFLMNLLDVYQVDLIIPLTDEGASFLSINKSAIEDKGVICAVEDWDIYKLASNKRDLIALCEKHSIGHPKTRVISSKSSSSAVNYVGFPSLIKPDKSMGARGIVKVCSSDDIDKVIKGLECEYGGLTLQEFIESNHYYYNVMLFRNEKGEILGETIIKIVRFFPLSGGSSCFAYVVNNPKLVEECTKVLEKLRWYGFADFDVLYDEEEEKYKIIELNPRIPASVEASAIAGVNFPKIIVANYLKDDDLMEEGIVKANTGFYLRYFILDLVWFFSSKNRFTCKPSWFKFRMKNMYYQDGGWDDPLVMLVGIVESLKKLVNIKYLKSKFKRV